jgi:hypothetical protein
MPYSPNHPASKRLAVKENICPISRERTSIRLTAVLSEAGLTWGS